MTEQRQLQELNSSCGKERVLARRHSPKCTSILLGQYCSSSARYAMGAYVSAYSGMSGMRGPIGVLGTFEVFCGCWSLPSGIVKLGERLPVAAGATLEKVPTRPFAGFELLLLTVVRDPLLLHDDGPACGKAFATAAASASVHSIRVCMLCDPLAERKVTVDAISMDSTCGGGEFQAQIFLRLLSETADAATATRKGTACLRTEGATTTTTVERGEQKMVRPTDERKG